MNRADEPNGARGLSRRRLLRGVGGGIAGATLASLGLDSRRPAKAQAGPISLRDLAGRLDPPVCDPGSGIRRGLPNDHPAISIRDVARRVAGRANLCKPMELSVFNERISNGDRVRITGTNFTPNGKVDILFRADRERNNFTDSARAQPDGTLVHVRELSCNWPEHVFTVYATDLATGRKAGGATAAYDCPQQPPPPPPPPVTPPTITVSQEGSAAGARFIVKGTGFLPSHDVHIRVTNNATLVSAFFTTGSDPAGALNHGLNIPCEPFVRLSFSANDERENPQDPTRGALWSNTVTLTCT
jgi:hypothetical protein